LGDCAVLVVGWVLECGAEQKSGGALVRGAKECNGRMARGKRSYCRERPVTARCIGRVLERRGGMGALSQGEDGMGWI
jgi:hypothetical protein